LNPDAAGMIAGSTGFFVLRLPVEDQLCTRLCATNVMTQAYYGLLNVTAQVVDTSYRIERPGEIE
jgi:hypothetical protein